MDGAVRIEPATARRKSSRRSGGHLEVLAPDEWGAHESIYFEATRHVGASAARRDHLAFLLVNLAPGDPVSAMIDPFTRAEMGEEWLEDTKEPTRTQ